MTPVKKPDLHAPRYRQDFINLVNNELLDKIKKKNSKAKDLTYKDLRKIINAFNGAMWNHVIESRYGVDLPESLGSVFIATCKASKRKNMNIPESIKLGISVLHQNWETDGNISKIMFSTFKVRSRFKHSEAWSFKAGRDFKRTVAATYPKNWMNYKKVENINVIAKRDERVRKGDYVSSRINHIPDNYNEFDLD